MADCFEEYINRWIFIAEKRKQYCVDCNRRKGMKNGKLRFCYDIGEAPCSACEINDMLNDVADFPAADVVPVHHAKDIYYKGDGHCEFKCSLCGVEIGVVEGGELDGGYFRYCPGCGAMVDGGA